MGLDFNLSDLLTILGALATILIFTVRLGHRQDAAEERRKEDKNQHEKDMARLEKARDDDKSQFEKEVSRIEEDRDGEMRQVEKELARIEKDVVTCKADHERVIQLEGDLQRTSEVQKGVNESLQRALERGEKLHDDLRTDVRDGHNRLRKDYHDHAMNGVTKALTAVDALEMQVWEIRNARGPKGRDDGRAGGRPGG